MELVQHVDGAAVARRVSDLSESGDPSYSINMYTVMVHSLKVYGITLCRNDLLIASC